MKTLSIKALALAAALFSANGASAVTLNVDSGWNGFAFGAVGTVAKRIFTFTLTGYANLSVTDGFFSGDQFQVVLNNISYGLTSTPVQGTTNVGANYASTFTNPNYSHWTHRIGPGTYLLELFVVQRSGTDTRDHLGGVRLDTAPVPLPATGALLLGAIGAGVAMRRRKAAN